MNWTTHPTARHATPTQRSRWARTIKQRDRTCRIDGPNCTGQADEADHIIPVAEGGPELDPSNGQGACVNCHKSKTQSEATRGNNKWKRKPEKHPGLR